MAEQFDSPIKYYVAENSVDFDTVTSYGVNQERNRKDQTKMSVQEQYESAHAAVQAFKEIRAKLDKINKYSADIDDLEDAVHGLMYDADDAQAKAQAVIDNIDDKGGVAAVERDMAAEARMDADREER